MRILQTNHWGAGVALAIAAFVALAVALPQAGDAQASSVRFRLTVENTTNPEMTVTPGAYLIHQDANAFWAPGQAAVLGLERIAEIGEPGEAVSALGAVALDPAPMAGDTVTVEFDASPGDHLSLAQMLVATNDTFVGVNSLPLWTDGRPTNTTLRSLAWDAGTEDNADLFAGFDEGQPDPAQGMANLDNGTATVDGVVSVSDQFVGYQATITVTPIGTTIDVGAGLSLIGWSGGDMSSADFLAMNPDVSQIFVWDGAGWQADSTVLPDALRPDITLSRGQGLFVVTEAAATIAMPLA